MIRKLGDLEASGIIDRMTRDEVPEGYREEVWEEQNENWFVGEEGALSFSGKCLTPQQWEEKGGIENHEP